MAGGTGIHPFSDLIDLMYKNFLINGSRIQENEITNYEPLAGYNFCNKFRFTLYLAVQ